MFYLVQGGNARCAHGSPLGPPGSRGRFAAYLVALRATPATIDRDYQCRQKNFIYSKKNY